MAKNQYKHMRPDERAIWQQAQRELRIPDNELTYDLTLGEGIPIDPAWPLWQRRMVMALSRKRADVIRHTAQEWTIIEIKTRIGMSAVGQLLCYRWLFMRKFRPTTPVKMLAIGQRKEPDMDYIMPLLDITMYIVGESETKTLT